MIISSETRNLISELSEFSNSKLKNIDALSYLIEASKAFGKEKLFNDLIFTAKYINGLEKILRRNAVFASAQDTKLNGGKAISNEAMDKIKTEYKEHLKKMSFGLKELIQNAEETERDQFISKYLSLTRESMLNLSRLIYDLAWLKIFINKQTRK